MAPTQAIQIPVYQQSQDYSDKYTGYPSCCQAVNKPETKTNQQQPGECDGEKSVGFSLANSIPRAKI